MTRVLLGALAACLATSALAQQPARDAKDYRIDMLVVQRNENADRLSFCYSENSVAIAGLQAENAKLKADLAEAKKAADSAAKP